jgi:DNA-binding transcriptional ArsR family regulator
VLQFVGYGFEMRAIKHPPTRALELPDIMHALSDPTRLEIVRKLSACKSGELTCSDLLGHRPKSSMSHHFRILRSAGLVETVIVGKEHMNRLRTADVNARFPGLLSSVLAALKRA